MDLSSSFSCSYFSVSFLTPHPLSPPLLILLLLYSPFPKCTLPLSFLTSHISFLLQVLQIPTRIHISLIPSHFWTFYFASTFILHPKPHYHIISHQPTFLPVLSFTRTTPLFLSALISTIYPPLHFQLNPN